MVDDSIVSGSEASSTFKTVSKGLARVDWADRQLLFDRFSDLLLYSF